MKKLLLLIGLCIASTLSIAQNNSLDFDGTDDFVLVPNHIDFNALNSITLEAWIFPKSYNNPGLNIIADKHQEWQFALGNGVLQFASRNTNPGFITVSSFTNIPLFEWSHVAISYDGATYDFYVNGILVSSSAANGQIDGAATFNNDVTIGKGNAPSTHFDGNIDEVSIWNTGRTHLQIQSDMAGNISCPTSGLIAYYKFNQGIAFGDNTAIANIQDCTGNHHGIPNLFALNNCASNFQGGFQPGNSGITITGNSLPCPESIEVYVANGFHTGVNWSVNGGSILNSTGCTVTVEWGSVEGNYTLTAQEIGVGTTTENIVIAGDLSMACNDLVNISVDSSCQAIVEAAMVLEGEILADEAFSVVVYDKQGNAIANNLLTKDNLGQVLKYTVTHLCSGNTCWGQLKVEDKWIPQLICSDTAIITQCGLDLEPETTGLPVGSGTDSLRISANQFKVWGFDPCDTITLSYNDEYTKYSCETDNYAQIIRYWNATDAFGNSSSCVDTINIKRGDISSVVFPPNFDGRPGNEDHLECNAGNNTSLQVVGWNQLANGYPSPHPRKVGSRTLIGTGYPLGVACDHIAVTYRDTKIESCGATYKLLRLWRVFDWCTGELKDTAQLIKVIDNMAPVIQCAGTNFAPADTINVDYYKCTATFEPPLPVVNSNPSDNDNVYVIEECSNWTYTVRHLASVDPENCTPQAGLGTPAKLIGYEPATGLPRYRIENMPLGCNWIYYTITDDCGHSTTCTSEYYVSDERQPVAVCDQHTAVSLSEFGEATLNATSVDNGSFDNCMVDSMAVRRMTDPHCGVPGNTSFGPSVAFCCDDISDNPIMVVFRVWDKNGNFNDCMVSVEVQDKIAPQIECPGDKRIECYLDARNPNVSGWATAEDICGGTVITYEDIDSSLNQCGLGWIKRRWSARDAGGRVDVCDQIITIIDSKPFDDKGIDWPNKTVYVNGCAINDAHPDLLPLADGRPKIDQNAAECAMVVTGYDDTPIYNIPNICVQIKRIWTVIDWCQFDRTNPNSTKGTWTFQQTINLRNNEKPKIDNSSCQNITLLANDNCEGELYVEASGSDDCTIDAKLIWWYQIDYNKNGTIDVEESGNIADRTVINGSHWFTWFVKDECGNIEKCRFNIDIEESKEPTPYCRKGLVTTLMGGSGSVEIWASDFNIGSFDNCTPDSLLRYSFSSDVKDQSKIYTCDSLENGISDTFSVEMWVTDLLGNQDFCVVDVIIQDNMDVCPDVVVTPFAMIAGNVKNESESALSNATVTLLKDHDYAADMKTSDDGLYSFDNLEKLSSYEIQIQRNDDYLNGVSTRDLVAIQKHLLGFKEFNNSYKMIAADANGSESVTTSDISLLRKLILGKISTLDNVESWRMLPNNYSFEDVNNPWSDEIPTSIKIASLENNMMQADFMALKIGDVTGDAKANNLKVVKTRSNDQLELLTSDRAVEQGERIVVAVNSNMFKNIEGLQFTLNVDPAFASIIGLKGDEIDISESNFAWNFIDRGMLTFSWNKQGNEQYKNEVKLFEIELEIYESARLSEIMYLSSTITKAEAYTSDEASLDVNLRFENNETEGFKLYQNRPNPFSNTTLIEFELPNAQIATISVLDITGKRILKKRINGQKGINSILISQDELTTKGIMYYQLESGEKVSTRKMLLLN